MTLLELMKGLRYPGADGYCFGMAHMAKQAILLGQIKNYHERLNIIDGIKSLKDFKTKTDKVRQKYTNKEILSKKEELLLEIPAFLDGVELYHNGYRYPR